MYVRFLIYGSKQLVEITKSDDHVHKRMFLSEIENNSLDCFSGGKKMESFEKQFWIRGLST